MVLSGVGLKLFANHHYKLGVAACEKKQRAADEKIKPIANELEDKIGAAEDVHETTITEIKTEYVGGISAIEVKRAQAEAMQLGKELGRAQGIAKAKLDGGCLNDVYSDDDQLFIDARGLQSDIFGDDPESYSPRGAYPLRGSAGPKDIPGP